MKAGPPRPAGRAPSGGPAKGFDPGQPGFGDRVLDLAGALLVVLDRDGRIVHFNGACQRATGYSSGQVRGKRLWDVLILPEDRAAVQAVFEQLRMGLYPNSFENYWRTRDGGQRFIAWVNTAILDENQDVEYVVGSGIDITDRKQAEDREREYAGYLAILSEAAMSLVRSSTRDNIYRLLAEGLSKLLPRALLISVGEFDSERRTLHIKETVAESEFIKRAEALLGAGVKGMSIKAGDKADIASILTGRLIHLSGGIHQATFGTIPKALCRTLEKLLGKPLVYGIGVSSGKSIYGTAAIFMPGGTRIENPAHLETFVNQASTALLRLEAEQQVKERERYFRAITENAGEIITILDPDGTIRYKSPAVRRELGYRPEELVGENIFGYIHPEDMARAQPAFRTVVENPGVPLKIEFRFRHKDGGWRTLDCTGVNLTDDPAVRGIVANSRDVTDRISDRERIRESEERYRLLADNSNEVVWTADLDNRLTYMSPSIERFQGYTVAEAMEMGMHGLVAPGSLETLAAVQSEAARQMVRGTFGQKEIKPVDYECRHKSGGTVWCETTAIVLTDKNGRPTGILGINRDITERKLGMAALQESEQRYRSILDSMGDLIHLVDRDRRIIYVNPAFRSFLEDLGLKPSVVGQTIMEAFPFLPEKVGEEYKRVFRTGQSLLTEESTALEGRKIFTETRKIPVEIGGRVERVVTVIRDVTERRRAEAEVRESRERFQRLADRVTEGISIYEKGELVYANERALEIFGRTMEEYRSKGLADLAAPEEAEKLRQAMEGSPHRGTPPEQATLWIVRGDGTRRCVHNRCYYTRKGKESLGYFMVTSDITEKRLNELALVESEKQYRELFESNPSPMWVYDPQTLAFIAVNEAAVRLYGYSRKEFSGMTLKDIRPLEDVPILLENVARSVRNKFDRTSMVRHRTKDGRLMSVEVIGHSVKFSGRDARLVMINDVTERQRIEEAVRDSEEKFRALAEQSPNMIFINQGGRVIYANPRCSQDMGYSAEEFYAPDFDFRKLIAPEHRETLEQVYRRHQQGQEVESHEYSLVAKNGRRLEAVLNTRLVDLKGGPAIVGIVTDVTGLRLAQRQLDESRLRLSQLVENMAEGVYRTSEEGKFLDANPAMARIFGYGSVEELMKADIRRDLYFSPDDRMRDYPGPGQERTRELRMKRRDGSEVWVEDSCRYVHDERGEVVVHEGVLRDVTERHRAEAALRELTQRFEYVLGATRTGFDIIDQDFNIVYIDPEWKKSYGEPGAKKCYQYFMGRDGVCPNCGIVAALSDKKTKVTEEYLEKEGRWVEVHSIPFQDSEGKWLAAEFNIDITERKSAAEALRKSEERHRTLVESMNDGLMQVDNDDLIQFVNERFCRMLGYSSGELVGRVSHELLIHPEDWDFIKDKNRERAAGTAGQYQVRMRRRDGREIWTSISASPVRDEGGRVSGSIGIVADVTESKLAADRQRESEERYRLLAEKVPEALFVYDDDRFVYANRAGLQLLGAKSFGELEGRDRYGFVHPDYRELARQRTKLVLSSAQEIPLMEQKVLRLDGSEVDVSAKSIPFPHQGRNLVMSIVRDITDWKRAEQALIASEEKYRGLAEASPDMIFIVDRAGTVSYINPAAASMVGRKAEEAVGAPISVFFPPEVHHRQWENISRVLETGRSIYVEGTTPFGDSPRHLDTWLVPLRSHRGQVTAVMGISRDITERKRMEQELRDSEQKYRQIFQGVAEGIYRSTPEGKPLMANPALVRMLGYGSLEENLARDIEREGYFDPEVRSEYKRLMEEKGEVRDFVNVWRRKDGSELVVRENAHAVRDERGEILYYEGTVEDVTEKNRVEEALRESEERFKAIFEFAADGMLLADIESKRFVLGNQRICRMLGYEPGELMALSVNDIHPAESLPAISATFASQSKNEFHLAVDQPVLRKDGSVFNAEINAFPITLGSKTYLMGIFRDTTDRKRAEDELSENQRRLSTLMDNLPGMAYRCRNDQRWTMEFVSQGCLDLTEYRPEEITGEGRFSFSDLIVDEDREMVWDEVQDSVKKRGPYQLLYRLRTRGGRLKWVWEQGVAVFDTRGRVQALEGFITDISPRMLAEEALYNSEHQYRTTIDAMGDPIHVLDRDLRIVLVNEAFKRVNRVLGFEPEAVGRGILEVYPYLDPARTGDEYRQVFESGKMLLTEERYVIGGREFITEARKIPVFEGGKVVRTVTVNRDITERRRAEQALRDSEEKYRQVFEGVAEGIYRTTPDGRIEMANPALLKILGFDSLEELRRIDLNRQGYADPGERGRFMELMAEKGEVRDFEAIWRRKDGRAVTLNENARAVRGEDGRVAFYEGTVEDVTLRKQAEQALVDEKNKLADLFQVSLTVAGTRNVPDKIGLTMDGIRHTSVFRRGALVIRNPDGTVKHFAHYGLEEGDAEKARASVVAPESAWDSLQRHGRRLSNSYLLRVTGDQKMEPGVVRIPSSQEPGQGWGPDDTLIIPLRIAGRKAGYITLDEPKSGSAPTLEEVHLLELFANQLSVSIENLSLYDDLERSYYSTLKAFVAAMEAKDPYTKGHSENVRHYALQIANSMDLAPERVTLIDYSALLHDIGKLGISEEILTKPDVLTHEEYQEVKLHPEIGSRMVSDIEKLDRTAHIIRSHHEYYDGQGYPTGISGEEIPLESRIISVADAYEAMTSDRPYRKAFDKREAVQRLKDSAGRQFDARIVEIFSEIVQEGK